jgi:hypothetical protein
MVALEVNFEGDLSTLDVRGGTTISNCSEPVPTDINFGIAGVRDLDPLRQLLIIWKGRYINPVLLIDLVRKSRDWGLEKAVPGNIPDGLLKPSLSLVQVVSEASVSEQVVAIG